LNVDLIVASSIFIIFVATVFLYLFGFQKQVPSWQSSIELRKKAADLMNEIIAQGKPENWEKENILPSKIGLASSAYLIPILISDESGYNRVNEPIAQEIAFDEKCNNIAWNGSVRIYDENFNEIPFRFVNQTFCPSGFLQKAILFFEINVSANSSRKLQIFFHNSTQVKSKDYGNFSSLVLWLTFDEGSGNIAYDYSGNGNNGTIYGATWVSGKYGKALQFNGNNTYVQVSDSDNLEPADITISMWIYPLSWTHTPTAVALVTKRTAIGNGYFVFWYASTSTINFDWGGYTYRWNTGYNSPLNSWTHLVVTRNNSQRVLYVNGEYYSSTPNSGNSTLVPTTANLRIGYDSYTNQYPFNGTIDEVRIYNRALSQEEILSHYQQPLIVKVFPKREASLISFEKIEALRNISYDLLKEALQKGYEFRVEIYEK
jgi:hypothetical protein